MPDTSESKIDEVINILKKIDGNINDYTQVLQKFGLDIITKFGKTTQNLKVLTDKVDQFHSTIIDIKSLIPLLNNIIEGQTALESEMDLIKSLIQRSKIININESEKTKENAKEISQIDDQEQITSRFKKLIKDIDGSDDIELVILKLEEIKQYIFELTGGHKILYEISQETKKINNEEKLTDELKSYINDKIKSWIKKL